VEWQLLGSSFFIMGGNTIVTERTGLLRAAAVVEKPKRSLMRWLDLAQDDPAALEGLAKDLLALPPCDASAHAVCELLEDTRLGWLRDEGGRNLRALAVAALLRMGYPWALRVTPEDLELMREEQRAAHAPVLRWMNALIALGPFFVAAAVLTGLALLQVTSLAASMMLIVLCSSATAAAVWIGAFSDKRREGFRAAAGVAIIAAITEWAWGVAMGGLDLMMIGSLPVVVCALLTMTTSLVTPAPLEA
jgi:hypothetical protein